MRSNDHEGIVEDFDALTAALDRVLECDFEGLTVPERLAMLERCELLRRRLPAVEHPLVNGLAAAEQAELGGRLVCAVADRLRITRGEARRRIDEAAELGPRRTLTGEPLGPVLPAVAAGQRDGELGAAHVRVIRDFFHHLPDAVDIETRATAEAQLAELGGQFRPDELTKLTARLYDWLNPDGLFSDTERARHRTLILGRQGSDGMSTITGALTPGARATPSMPCSPAGPPRACATPTTTPRVSPAPPHKPRSSPTAAAPGSATMTS